MGVTTTTKGRRTSVERDGVNIGQVIRNGEQFIAIAITNVAPFEQPLGATDDLDAAVKSVARVGTGY